MTLANVTTVITPDGPFSIVATAEAVLASGWTADIPALIGLVNPRLQPNPHEITVRTRPGAAETLGTAADAVAAFYEGEFGAPGRVPVEQLSGVFRRHAWQALRAVEPGQTLSYAQFAARAGRPRAVRAAAGACALNAAALFVPCHRVVRSDGGLGGFRDGIELKRRLLEREQSA